MSFWGRRTPVFREFVSNDWQVAVFYTEQARADPEGGCAPMGYYYARLSGRHQNLLLYIQRQSSKPDGDELSLAVRQMAELLDNAMKRTKSPNQAS